MSVGMRDFTKERIALFTRYFIEDGRPITVKQLTKLAEDYCGYPPRRQTIYSDLNCIDIAIGLKREIIGLNTGRGGYTALWSRPKK